MPSLCCYVPEPNQLYKYGCGEARLIWTHSIPSRTLVTIIAAHIKNQLLQTWMLIESYIREKNIHRPDSQVPLRGYMELLGCYITRELGAVSPSVVRARNRLIDLWALIRVDLKHGWTVEDMASHAGMCRTSLHSICMKTYGVSPKNIVVKMRMERAVELLTFTDHTLEHIAESIGYDTAFSFSRAFKSYSEVSPREFRKKISLPGESSS